MVVGLGLDAVTVAAVVGAVVVMAAEMVVLVPDKDPVAPRPTEAVAVPSARSLVPQVRRPQPGDETPLQAIPVLPPRLHPGARRHELWRTPHTQR